MQEGLCSHLGTSSACHTHVPPSGPTKQGCCSFLFKELRCREGKRRGQGDRSGLPLAGKRFSLSLVNLQDTLSNL